MDLMKRVTVALLVLALTLLQTACSTPWRSAKSGSDNGITPSVPATQVALPITGQTPGPTAVATAPLSPSATQAAPVISQTSAPNTAASGAQPSITVLDQVVQNRQVVVNDVVSSGPGWVAIYTVANGQPDQRLGFVAVGSGDNKDVAVPVDPGQATDSLMALLHTDAGKPGVFEYPGPDTPVIRGLQIVSAQFHISTGQAANGQPQPSPSAPAATSMAAMMGTPDTAFGRVGQSVSGDQFGPNGQAPSVTVTDQRIHNGLVIIPQVYSHGNMWLVIHPQYPDGTLGNFIGYFLLHDGLNTNVRVTVDTTRTKESLVAMLHINQSQARTPQYPGPDMPYMLNGEMVAPVFKIQGPLTGDVLLTSSEAGGSLHLADSYGLPLYTNTNDKPGERICADDCLGNFRPLLANGAFHVGVRAALDKIGVISRPDGTKQVTYGGAPLYYNVEDVSPSDTLGQSADGVWAKVKP